MQGSFNIGPQPPAPLGARPQQQQQPTRRPPGDDLQRGTRPTQDFASQQQPGMIAQPATFPGASPAALGTYSNVPAGAGAPAPQALGTYSNVPAGAGAPAPAAEPQQEWDDLRYAAPQMAQHEGGGQGLRAAAAARGGTMPDLNRNRGAGQEGEQPFISSQYGAGQPQRQPLGMRPRNPWRGGHVGQRPMMPRPPQPAAEPAPQSIATQQLQPQRY